MKTLLLGIAVTIASLFGMATGARAETGTIVVNIDRDFVASGKTFSAGKYTVFRLSPVTLVLRRVDTGVSVFLISSNQNPAHSGQSLEVKLTLAGDVYYLSEVATDLGVYSLPAPKLLTSMAKAKDHATTGASASN